MMRSPSLILALLLAVSSGCAQNRRPATTAPDATPVPSLGGPDRVVAAGAADAAAEAITGWFCPMHSDVTSDGPGKCKKCGMALIAGDPFDTRDYTLEFSTSPASVQARVPFQMMFKVRHPGTGRDVRDFEVVHDKQFHLFLISQDMSFFQHLHPEKRSDGSWALEVTLPAPGYYRVLSDFLPAGGSPQFLGRTLVTSDFAGDLLSQSARLEVDRTLEKTVDTITAQVQLDPPKLIAGRYGHMQFTLTDARTGEPVKDLQPYLGAFGHTLVLSEDMQDYVHSHPTEGLESDITKGFGGPRVSFEGYMPRPGRYRAWTQFLRKGQLSTVSFTFDVLTLEDAVKAP